jgi:hypothetical protein
VQYVEPIVNAAAIILKWTGYCVVGSFTVLGAASLLGVL